MVREGFFVKRYLNWDLKNEKRLVRWKDEEEYEDWGKSKFKGFGMSFTCWGVERRLVCMRKGEWKEILWEK